MFLVRQGVTDELMSHLIFEGCDAKQVSREHSYKVSILYLL